MQSFTQLHHRTRLLGLLLSSGALLACVVGLGIWSTHHSNSSQHVTLASDNTPADPGNLIPVQGGGNQPNNQAMPSTASGATTPRAASTAPASQPPSTSYTLSFDRSKFISDANSTLAAYGQIHDLLTFDATTTASMKVDRIKQAAAIDQQAFGQVAYLETDLGSSAGAHSSYEQAAHTAESAAAEVSAGVSTLNQWANSQSGTSSYTGGLNDVANGMQQFVQFSNELAAL